MRYGGGGGVVAGCPASPARSAIASGQENGAGRGGLQARGICVTVAKDRFLLEDISFDARPGTLTAVIGPSGAGKSTLARVLAGETRPRRGAVRFNGHDVHGEFAAFRSRIGMVPQDDVIHGQLTVNQALGYAAQLRMPRSDRQDRQRVIAGVLDELRLTQHADTRIDTLSGGQRKRASIALELLTDPELLILDEPTTGLDPVLDQQVMRMLRRLADTGRVVVVVTHSLANLDLCDQLLLLAPGGKTAFCGPPGDLGPAMGGTDWADIFTDIRADPDAALARFRQRAAASGLEPLPPRPAMPLRAAAVPALVDRCRQVRTVARRQVALLSANRGYRWLLVLLPFVVGLLPLTVPGHTGFGHPPFDGPAPLEPRQLITMMNFAAVLMGTTLTARELVGERSIFRREQAAGLSGSAYLLGKAAVLGSVALAQATVLVLVVTAPVIGKPAPSSAAALGRPMIELFGAVGLTCVAAAASGLAMSATVRTSDQVIVWLAGTLTAQFVLAGGTIEVTGRPLLDPISWFAPARWGFAAPAATVDLTNLVEIAHDAHWQHTASAWLFNIAMLTALVVGYTGFARWTIRLGR